MDSVSKYKNHDFIMDENWNVYISSVHPPPTRTQLEKLKRKWYQQNIDPSFDIKFDAAPVNQGGDPKKDEGQTEKEPQKKDNPQENPVEEKAKTEEKATKEENTQKPHQHHENCSHAHAHHQEQPQQRTVSKLIEAIFTVEGFLKCYFLLSLVLARESSTITALVICILALIRQCKRPRWNREYAEKLIYNEYFHNIWYILPFFFFPRQQSLMFFLPLTIHIWIGFCEYVNLKSQTLMKVMRGAVEKTRARRVSLMCVKQKIEIFMMFFLFIMLFFAQSNLLILILYSNYIRIKYVVNRNLVLAFYEIDIWIRHNIVKDTSPRALQWLYAKICAFCRYMVTPSNLKKEEEKKEEEKKTS